MQGTTPRKSAALWKPEKYMLCSAWQEHPQHPQHPAVCTQRVEERHLTSTLVTVDTAESATVAYAKETAAMRSSSPIFFLLLAILCVRCLNA